MQLVARNQPACQLLWKVDRDFEASRNRHDSSLASKIEAMSFVMVLESEASRVSLLSGSSMHRLTHQKIRPGCRVLVEMEAPPATTLRSPVLCTCFCFPGRLSIQKECPMQSQAKHPDLGAVLPDRTTILGASLSFRV